jgi:hypothetical protein
MKTGSRVKVATFNGGLSAPKGTAPKEDYWKLIGHVGSLIDVEEEMALFTTVGPSARVCIQFDQDPVELGLQAHNRVKRSLWLLCSDLRTAEEPSQPTIPSDRGSS